MHFLSIFALNRCKLMCFIGLPQMHSGYVTMQFAVYVSIHLLGPNACSVLSAPLEGCLPAHIIIIITCISGYQVRSQFV